MMEEPQIFDNRPCYLGEGPFWHPTRQQLFWFDIVNCRLLSRIGKQALTWQFDRNVSAGGWIDKDTILVASETGLTRFNIETGWETPLCPIEENDPSTRSNDGRADPWGGYWLGTMSKTGELHKGKLYRWLPDKIGFGELRVLEQGLSTPNAICFDHHQSLAYFSDTKERVIWKTCVDPKTGWPKGRKSVFLDLTATSTRPEFKPDGAILDDEGCLWVAQWGAARISRYSSHGNFIYSIDLPTGHTSCPAFGGDKMKTLFVTTAQEKLPEDRPEWVETAGCTFSVDVSVTGKPEPQIVLD